MNRTGWLLEVFLTKLAWQRVDRSSENCWLDWYRARINIRDEDICINLDR